MNNITIGIVARDEFINNNIYQAVTKNNLKYLHNSCNYIGILNYNNDKDINLEVLNLCDGIIIQGGTDIHDYHFKILDYALKNHIPLLGICMGHQIIGLYSTNSTEDDLIKINDHYILDRLHSITFTNDSKLKKILGKNIQVNSRHLYKIKKVGSPFKISALSDDGVIEAIELINDKNFVIGVQWHPEDLNNMENLYKYFFEEIKKRKKSKNN